MRAQEATIDIRPIITMLRLLALAGLACSLTATHGHASQNEGSLAFSESCKPMTVITIFLTKGEAFEPITECDILDTDGNDIVQEISFSCDGTHNLDLVTITAEKYNEELSGSRSLDLTIDCDKTTTHSTSTSTPCNGIEFKWVGADLAHFATDCTD